MKTIVVSGVNLFKAGSLKVMQECIEILSIHLGPDNKIIALVHNQDQYKKYDNVEYIAFPKSRKSYFFRLYYEYVGFYKFSKKIKPDYWFSMHDATPNVIAGKRFVYCHNSFPFYKTGLKDLFIQPGIFMLSLFSRYIFKINIKKNDYVIVQQEWTRKAFQKMFSINNIVVALPVSPKLISGSQDIVEEQRKISGKIFFYPMTPMVHKNLEIIGDAVTILEKEGVDNFKVVLTLDGKENKYANRIYKKYSFLKNIVFKGLLSQEEVNRHYQNSDCLLFSSKTESWGLPLTEAKEYNKAIFASNLPYSYEAIGKYDKAKFFNPDDARQLANIMKDFINESIKYDKTESLIYEEPYVKNWNELISFLFNF